jgi:prepilin-type processing-associated H-X9-DG protein
VTGPFFKGFITENQIVSPSQMIMFGDAKADGSFDGSLDPTEQGQWPSSRHSRRSNLLFVDSHIETPLRWNVIDPGADNPWRNRWNNDNQPHNDLIWSVDPAVEAVLGP